MSSLLERYLPPIPYVPETPERLVNLEGQPISPPEHFDITLTEHLNKYRPLWAIGIMRGLVVKKKSLDPKDPLVNTHPVSFTVSVWCGGLEAQGITLHLRILTTIGKAKEEVNGQTRLEKCILTLCKMHVVRPQNARNAIKRPLDAIDHLDNAKKDIMENCSTQEGGLSRREAAARISELQEAVGEMKK